MDNYGRSAAAARESDTYCLQAWAVLNNRQSGMATIVGWAVMCEAINPAMDWYLTSARQTVPEYQAGSTSYLTVERQRRTTWCGFDFHRPYIAVVRHFVDPGYQTPPIGQYPWKKLKIGSPSGFPNSWECNGWRPHYPTGGGLII